MIAKSKTIQTLFGSGLGLLATIIVHLAAWLLAGLALALLVAVVGGGIDYLIEPEIAQDSLTFSFGLAALFWPITLLFLLAGVSVAIEVILALALPPIALMLLFGLTVGGLAGYLYQRPLLQKRPYLTGALLGLLLNLLALTILALWQTTSFLILTPGYFCLGPITGVLALYFIRLVLPVASDETTFAEKYVAPAG